MVQNVSRSLEKNTIRDGVHGGIRRIHSENICLYSF
jgi:hypothetical protein